MSFFSKLFGRKTAETETKVGGMEDFMTLIRVYLQASIAAQVGISNLAVLPDLRVFKQTLKVPTVNNKLGVGEKKRCAKMLNEIYHVSETFPTEIDTSVKQEIAGRATLHAAIPRILTRPDDGHGKSHAVEIPPAGIHAQCPENNDGENRA